MSSSGGVATRGSYGRSAVHRAPRAVSGGYDHQMIYKIVKRHYSFICAKAGIYSDSDNGDNDEDV